MKPMKEHRYRVSGMHCASCELLVEKRILEEKGVKAVEASKGSGEVRIEYKNNKPGIGRLNKMFAKEGYVFGEKGGTEKGSQKGNMLKAGGIGLILMAGFLVLNKLGLAGKVGVATGSSLGAFWVLGLLAGVSSCAALVGGIVLSMSKQWQGKIEPQIYFNLGRLISYTIVGLILGAVGSIFKLSPIFSLFLVIGVSVLMIVMGMQMLGVVALTKFQIAVPKSVSKKIMEGGEKKEAYVPFLIGALTVLLPCGFTITTESVAIISGNPLRGAEIMLAFALGTLPSLGLIGFSSMKFLEKPHMSDLFLKVAGILVVFFAFFNINAQLNVLGVTSLNDLKTKEKVETGKVKRDDMVPIENGKQIMEMRVAASGYAPNYFKIRAGMPVVWKIKDEGSSGCTNAVIARDLFFGEIRLKRGETSVREFTVEKPGRYKFSCWMGMVSGVIEVIK